VRSNLRLALVGFTALAFGLGVSAQAEAVTLTTGSGSYMGEINPDIPAGPETTYVNKLSEMAPSTQTTFSGQLITRSANNLCYNACPDPVFAGKDETGDTSFNLVNFTGYVLSKYDAAQGGALVWYFTSFTGEIIVPSSFGSCGNSGCGLSHTSFFGGVPGEVTPEDVPGDVVPEPASLLLLGAGLSAAAVRARRRNAAQNA
jgi:hypothetical protein